MLLPAAEAEAATETTEHREAPRLGGDETLLLCEDEDGVRELLELVLTGAGYTVLSAAGPEQALALAASHEHEIDALVTDIVMPGMSGLQLADRLAPLRVLFISGYSEAAGGRPAGSAFLEKPFDHGALLAEVRSLFDRPAHRISR